MTDKPEAIAIPPVPTLLLDAIEASLRANPQVVQQVIIGAILAWLISFLPKPPAPPVA